MENLLISGQRVLMSVPFFALIAGLLLGGKKLFDLTTSYDFDEELTEKDNPAFGVAMAGFLLSLAIALGGSGYGAGGGSVAEAFLSLLVYGVLSIVLLRLSILISDRLILPSFSIHKEIVEDRNLGTAYVVAGACVATGLVLAGALTGESVSFLRGIVFYGMILALVVIVAGVVFGLGLGVWFSIAMVGLAGAAILYDTSNVLHHYPEDRYVAASLQLFASIALLFWYVLQLFLASDS